MQAHILIVEDEPAIAELISVNLKYAKFTYQIAADASSAKTIVDAKLPDLVLLDWMLPGESGLSLAKFWRASQRTHILPIIMLTAKGDDQDIVRGLDAGADDYIVKPFSSQEMLARIRAVLRRKVPEVAEEEINIAGLSLNPATQTVMWNNERIRMGNSEFKLLSYLMAHPDRVYTRTQLLDRVWGDHVFIEERTIDVHIKRLRAVLKQANVPDPIETIRGTGYRFLSKE
ncbi:MAG TPA: phosphate regulon transcriptional regulatory protein PhoB [Pasteurellaceae bacterium]|nr:phosphate regulon transcriptional regulatory protein PhoB [Pasteurellaceae bacterium]